jgi:hypothetical protein
MPFELPEIPHRRIGAKCSGTILPVETQEDGKSTIMFECNGCGQVLGMLNAALARAFALALYDDLVISRMDENDPTAKVLTGISDECRVEQCNSCPGIFYPEEALGEPVFCTHVCHERLSASGVCAVS